MFFYLAFLSRQQGEMTPESFTQYTGLKCDIMLRTQKKIIFEKEKSYCFFGEILIQASKEFTLKAKHYNMEAGGLTSTKVFKSPFYTTDDTFGTITGNEDDCKASIEYLRPLNTADLKLFHVNSEETTFNVMHQNEQMLSLQVINAKKATAKISNMPVEVDGTPQGIGSLGQFSMKFEISFSSASRKLLEDEYPIIPSFIGRAPKNSGVYKMEDLKNELKNAGSVDQEKSQQGVGEDEKSGDSDSGSGGSCEIKIPQTEPVITDEEQIKNSVKELEKFGLKCSNILQRNDKLEPTTIPKGETYCSLPFKNYLIGSKQKFDVITRQDSNDIKFTKFTNPLFVNASFSQVTCSDSSDCKVYYIPIFGNLYTTKEDISCKYTGYTALSNDNADFKFKVNRSSSAEVIYFNSKAATMTMTQGENEQTTKPSSKLFDEFIQGKSETDVSVQFKASAASKRTLSEDEWPFPKLIGRLPENPGVFTAKDLETEYKTPGTVNQENSEKGTGEEVAPPNGLSKNAVIAIAVGILLAIIVIIVLICVGVYCLICRKKKDSDEKKNSGSGSGENV